ncbi:hypothetical protein [Rheinheimera baltica]|uniref:Lipoprotein n=1 Tax=Rheinheimera baltica TaxID=67576 RepID=A0ABT9I3U2_9GAMM|nr:hypothetical protein [Rheinheimera baltica]MDP5138036.1 hypothetical protein [Rheinheimera baltica]MDP5142283.1 hypothetical protein [Rheinheimera baltica]MDP5150819.1 hypothetical protein [Rheinheimera baltica]MDP5188368.1 hypothetical protein [Rheinheimera baltica]
MKTKVISVLMAVAVMTLAGCSTAPANYTYVVDTDLAEQANSLTRTQAHTGHVVWLNPPMKRVPVNEQK